MSIRLPGLPDGVEPQRICHGNMVGPDEFEIHGKNITKGGRFAVSAVVVKAAEGWEFVADEKRPGKFVVQKSEAPKENVDANAA
jgi:hypothetical protein